MDEKIIDNKITESLIKGTEPALDFKRSVWKNIENSIEDDQKMGEMIMSKKKKRRSLFITIASTAAAIGIIFVVSTESGRAAAGKIREFFLPEKEIVQELEGQDEQTHVNLNESEMGYVIYIDESRYEMEKLDGKDRIVFKGELSDEMPDVYMEIEQVKDKTPKELATEIESGLKTSFETVRNDGEVEEPLRAISLYGRDGDEWNSKVVQYYLVNNRKGGTFIIKQQFFYEASEGHGARFYHMLKDFEIVELTE